eukprot:TRINITY_DN11513_c0_g2_i1.p1 TRINITY_DN11513_c0_g2~~TRINITY_DN11513_c0_g2_i1.p1  ORF type:complete len:352 (+),score=16.59 TRINITY_DN11513_c0_g2_i1:78-1133(+)
MLLFGSGVTEIDTGESTAVLRRERTDSVGFGAIAVIDIPGGPDFELRLKPLDALSHDPYYGPVIVGLIDRGRLPQRNNIWKDTYDADEEGIEGFCTVHDAYLISFIGDQFTPGRQMQRLTESREPILHVNQSTILRFVAGKVTLQSGSHEVPVFQDCQTELEELRLVPCILFSCDPLVHRPQYPIEVSLRGTKRRRRSETLNENLWNQRLFTDAVIKCGSVSHQVHRAVLCAASPVFQRAFAGEFRESQEACYEVKNVQPAAVEALLRYIYTGAIPAEANEDVLELSIQYELLDLCREVACFFLFGLSLDNVRARVAALRRHAEHAAVKPAVEEMLTVLSKDRALLLASLV